MTCIARTEEAVDILAIAAVNRACFPTDAEANLVDALRAAGRLSISLVAVVDSEVVGHVAFSPVTAASGAVGWITRGLPHDKGSPLSHRRFRTTTRPIATRLIEAAAGKNPVNHVCKL